MYEGPGCGDGARSRGHLSYLTKREGHSMSAVLVTMVATNIAKVPLQDAGTVRGPVGI